MNYISVNSIEVYVHNGPLIVIALIEGKCCINYEGGFFFVL